ncbi:MAG: hypothetical protein LBG93_02560 [Treponema sp.]|nr:hypothetical protein [Treponema sp.]MDR0511972.1 hypothetical protein [Treponema sp.]
MGRIKSALEIALERSDSIKSDKQSIELFEAKQKGKKLANEFLEGTITSLPDEIKKESPGSQANLKQGIFDVLVSRIVLPQNKDELTRIEAAIQGLAAVSGDKRLGQIAGQFTQVMEQYLEEAEQFEEAVKRQYAPKLRQKEEELSRRLGRQIKIDPFQDPEFVAFFTQHLNGLKANYQAAADQVREEVTRVFSG